MDSLKRISQYKAHMMGIAVMIVVYGHLLYYHGNLINYEDNHWTEWYTLGSVEMFIFLSGFGIYQSLAHSRDAGKFYIKRLSRLAPAYFPVMLAWCGINVLKHRMLLTEAVGNLTALGWWFQTGNQFNWYVPATVVLYLISPLLFDAVKAGKTRWAMAAMLIINVAAWRSNLMMAISRFPTYLLGMWFGRRMAEGQKVGRREMAFYGGIGVLAMALVPFFFLLPRGLEIFAPAYRICDRFGFTPRGLLWYYGMYWNLFFIASPLWMFGISRLLELGDRILVGRWINRVWSFLGVRSFEIYLCHLALYDTMLKLGVHGWPRWICIAVAGTCIGILYHQAVDQCTAWWKNRNRRHISPPPL